MDLNVEVHSNKYEQEVNRLADQYNDLINKIHEKGKYIDETSQNSIEIVINWYERLINDLIESQTQMIENIQNERDRARNELRKFESNIQTIHQDIEQINTEINLNGIQNKLNDFTQKLTNYEITKEIYLPNSYTFQPRYKISYQFKEFSSTEEGEEEEENWDIETNETVISPLSAGLKATTTDTSIFFPNTAPAFVVPKDEDAEEWNDFQWHEQLQENHPLDSECFLDPSLYQIGTSRQFNTDIHLIASNGNDLLCYSRQTKQLIYSVDADVNSTILQWYHGHLLQLIWFDHLKSFVTITDNHRYEIYSIQCMSNLRLKIRLHTCLPATNSEIIKDQIYLRMDDNHLFIYYERINGRKRLCLLNPTYECVQSYSIDQCLQRDEHLRSHDNGLVLGLGVNEEQIVLFVRSIIDDDLADQAAAIQMNDTRLLVFEKSTMCFIRRVILSIAHIQYPFVVHFLDLSSFIFIDQIEHLLRFYNYEKSLGQINLLFSKSNLSSQYSSIVLMNDGSLFLSNNTRQLIRFILQDQSNDW